MKIVIKNWQKLIIVMLVLVMPISAVTVVGLHNKDTATRVFGVQQNQANVINDILGRRLSSRSVNAYSQDEQDLLASTILPYVQWKDDMQVELNIPQEIAQYLDATVVQYIDDEVDRVNSYAATGGLPDGGGGTSGGSQVNETSYIERWGLFNLGYHVALTQKQSLDLQVACAYVMGVGVVVSLLSPLTGPGAVFIESVAIAMSLEAAAVYLMLLKFTTPNGVWINFYPIIPVGAGGR